MRPAFLANSFSPPLPVHFLTLLLPESATITISDFHTIPSSGLIEQQDPLHLLIVSVEIWLITLTVFRLTRPLTIDQIYSH